jgi:5'-3' exonuclease
MLRAWWLWRVCLFVCVWRRCRLLPEVVRPLLLDAASPLADLYPATFQTDRNGKINEWEAVVLIPFVDAQRIKDALTPLLSSLDDAAVARNRHGPRYRWWAAGRLLPTLC